MKNNLLYLYSRIILIAALLVSLFAAPLVAQYTNGQSASGVIGQLDYIHSNPNMTDQYGLDGPFAIAVDQSTGVVWVADTYNNRVLRYDSSGSLTTGSGAAEVLGQPDFKSSSAATLQNGMNSPSGVAVDGLGNLYVVDNVNNRVLIYLNAASKPNGANADIVLGQPNFTSSGAATSQNGMNSPYGVAVDASGNLYVADRGNNRVLKFSNAASDTNGANADIVLGQPNFTSNASSCTSSSFNGPFGVAVDGSGNLYVADIGNNRVLKFSNAASKVSGANADTVLGQPDFTSSGAATSQNGMSNPSGVAVDGSGNLYVADNGNNRVLKFSNAASKVSGANADAVLGQLDFTSSGTATSQNGMYGPSGVAVDGSGNLYVADNNNNRIMKFLDAANASNGANASIVLGQYTFTASLPDCEDGIGLSSPMGVAVDPSSGAVYVADTYNNRVLRYASASSYSTGSSALQVFGQPDFYSSASDTTQNGMNGPDAVAVDDSGNLYVADNGNSRVLIFLNAASKGNGANADKVLGQPNFTSSGAATSQNGMSNPSGVAVDGSGNLYVADNGNNRVLIFKNAVSKANGADADIVLGQTDFTSAVYATTQNGMINPEGVAVDDSGTLYVVDYGNSRVLKFDSAAAKSNGANADGVLGQSDFVSLTTATTQSGMNYPSDVAVDGSGNLYVADKLNNRVLVFNNASSDTNGAKANIVLGQADFNSNVAAATQSGMSNPYGIAANSTANKLYVADYNNSRILIYDASSPLPVELTSFTASSVVAKVTLNWKTATEVNNYGFDIEREVSSQKSVVSSWENIGFVKGSGNSNSPKNYSFVDDNPISGKVDYRLKQIDNDGSFKYSSVVDVTTLPKQFSLGQNYPNPFNPTTTISISLPVDSKVVLEVYNTLGQRVATLENGEMQPGVHNVEFNASRLASGIYFYKMQTNGFVSVKKLLLLK